MLLTILAIVAAAFLYRRTQPPVSPSRRWILTGLRAATFVLFLLLLFDPILHLRFTTSTPPVLAVLFDNSKSIRIVDRSGNRSAEMASVRNAAVFKRIASRATMLPYTFGINLRPLSSPPGDSLALDEGGTDIAAAMRSIADARGRQQINALVLVTDGTYTLGRDPLNETALLGIPTYCVGIGDTTEQKDILVSSVAANDLVYAGTQSPVRATITSAGFDSTTVEVSLSKGGRVLDRKPLRLQSGSREYIVDLSYVPEGDGLQRFTVNVSSLPGEISTANNRRSFTARVLKSKLRILVLGGEPSPDITVVRQTLTEDPNLRVRTFTQETGGAFYEGRLAPTEFDSVDCLVFIGFPTATSSPEVIRQIAQRISTSFTPVLFIDGKHASVTTFPAVAQLMPFVVGLRTTTEQIVAFQPADDQREHPILSSGGATDAWNDLPPIFRTVGSYTVRPGALILGSVRTGSGPPRDPLLIARSVNQVKTVALLGYGIWRWRLMTQQSAQTADLLATFLGNSIKWLTTPEERRPVRVSPVSDSFPEGEAVQFTGQAYNPNAEPLENASIHVTAELGDRRFDTDLRPIGGGRYEGSMDGLTEGDYTYRATGSVSGTSIGEDRGRFVVGGTELEFQDTRANHLLLRQIAYRTGGEYLNADAIDHLDSLLFAHPSFVQQSLMHSTDASLRQAIWLIGAIILLLAAEWLLRKQSGML